MLNIEREENKLDIGYFSGKSVDTRDYTFKELQDIKAAVDESVIVAITDNRGKITFVNNQFCEISKYTREELIGNDHRILNSGFHPSSFFRNMWKTIGSGENWYGEICNRAKDGSLYWVQTTIVPFLNENNIPYQYIAIRTDITAQKDIEKITYLAYHDDLTSLPNRRSLQQRLNLEVKNTNQTFAVFILNVNRFKNINDELGHVIGDTFLVELANRLHEIDDTATSFYRQNSDEFIYVLNDISRLDEMAQKMIKVFDNSFKIDDYEFYATVSIGISIYPFNGDSVDNLMKNADKAMFSAKENRGNSYCVYREEIHNNNDQSLVLETKLHKALLNNSLYLNYQPKFDIQSGKMTGMEALLRWTDDELGVVPPLRFIPIAEQCGLINDIGVWVLRKASAQMKAWNDQYGTDYHVAVNISPIHLCSKGFIEMLEGVIKESGIQPKHLEIEITEMSLMDYSDELMETIKRIRELGVAISIDDFGTGYSSLSYLKNFPVNTLKIDRSFVNNIIPEKSGVAMISAIISLAHALNLNVVAEGVEDEKELEVLRERGCEYVQGYYYSKPLDEEAFQQKIIEEISTP